jgi:hypothetical protein
MEVVHPSPLFAACQLQPQSPGHCRTVEMAAPGWSVASSQQALTSRRLWVWMKSLYKASIFIHLDFATYLSCKELFGMGDGADLFLMVTQIW